MADLEIDFKFFVEGIFLVLVGIGGIIGNFLGIVWFYKKVVQRNFHQLMFSLAVVDTVYILGTIFIFSIPSLNNRVWESYTYTQMFTVVLPVCQMALTASTYLTLAVAVERYTTVCHPFFKVTHQFHAIKFYILPILVFSILYNLPKFFELTVVEMNNTTEHQSTSPLNTSMMMNTTMEDEEEEATIFSIGPTPMRAHPLYLKIYLIILNLITHCILPITSLIFFNLAVYNKVRKMSRELDHGNTISRAPLHHREIKLAKVSVSIVAVYIICHGIRWIPNIWEFVHSGTENDRYWPPWVAYLTCFSHLATTFNSSVNFYIYIGKHQTGRRWSVVRGARCHQQASRQVSRVSSKLTVTTQTNGRKISEAVLMAEYSPSMTRLSVPAAALTATTQS